MAKIMGLGTSVVAVDMKRLVVLEVVEHDLLFEAVLARTKSGLDVEARKAEERLGALEKATNHMHTTARTVIVVLWKLKDPANLLLRSYMIYTARRLIDTARPRG